MVKVSPNGESFVLSSDCVGIIITGHDLGIDPFWPPILCVLV